MSIACHYVCLDQISLIAPFTFEKNTVFRKFQFYCVLTVKTKNTLYVENFRVEHIAITFKHFKTVNGMKIHVFGKFGPIRMSNLGVIAGFSVN